MADYLVGDIQGCDAALEALLHKIDFSPSRDTLYPLGDLVNRGPDSLATLRRLARMQGAAQPVLGNHDIHLLASAYGVRPLGRKDSLWQVLQAPGYEEWVDWLRMQPFARMLSTGLEPLLMVHAGVMPSWTYNQALAFSDELVCQLQSADPSEFLRNIYGNEPDTWNDGLQGIPRWRVMVNAFTRLRYCDSSGRMDFGYKGAPEQAPKGLKPWFAMRKRATAKVACIAFGHWSTLGATQRKDAVCLDSGCIWGGCLSALHWKGALGNSETIQVQCDAFLTPGEA